MNGLTFYGNYRWWIKIEKEVESFLYQGLRPICRAGTFTGDLCKMNTSLYPGSFRG